ncbi:MAG: HD domain-containing protein [Patescibacteria group bacterium]|jgi:uncharacterized protein
MSGEDKILKHLRKKLPEHVVEHSLRVAVIAENLAQKEGADEEICYVAGLLHDLGYEKDFKNHALKGAELAREFLQKNNIAQEIQEEVIIAIRTHQLDPEPSTLEGWIISDADIIERIGPLGIHRSYINALYWSKLEPEELLDYFDAVLESTNDLYTATAKRFARKDIAYLKDFINRVEDDATTGEDEA